jgi:hypothetical protein
MRRDAEVAGINTVRSEAPEHRSLPAMLAPTRAGLIAKGMIWSPTHGDTAFTVPLFDEFMKRIMPGNDWKTIGS